MEAHRLGLELEALQPEDYVSTERAAAALQKAPKTLQNWRRDGKFLPYTQVGGGQVLYRVSDLREFLRCSRVEPIAASSAE